jgi:ribonucleoside-diphosphate reductase beta chain
MMSVNILEAIRFYVSFACSFAFAERELMEGNAKIIELKSRQPYTHNSEILKTNQAKSNTNNVFNLCGTTHKITKNATQLKIAA